MHSYVGDFCLAAGLEGHAAGTLVRVSVSARDRARVVLHFDNHDDVVTDACVLLCGSVGELVLLNRGYNGPLVTRPLLAPRERARRERGLADVDAALPETERMHRT